MISIRWKNGTQEWIEPRAWSIYPAATLRIEAAKPEEVPV